MLISSLEEIVYYVHYNHLIVTSLREINNTKKNVKNIKGLRSLNKYQRQASNLHDRCGSQDFKSCVSNQFHHAGDL
jgi:hypothetical protein